MSHFRDGSFLFKLVAFMAFRFDSSGASLALPEGPSRQIFRSRLASFEGAVSVLILWRSMPRVGGHSHGPMLVCRAEGSGSYASA